MRTRHDDKLHGLATLPLGVGSSRADLTALGRLCDVVRVEEGTVLQAEGGSARFCWSIVRGAASISRHDHPQAVATSGAWLLDGLSTAPDGAMTTVVAMTDLDVVVFGRREIRGAVHSVPSLARAVRSAQARPRPWMRREPGPSLDQRVVT
jgi:hypothetical protein